MDKLYRAILMTLPIDQKGSVARTYRRELAKLEAQGRAEKRNGEWERTIIGNAYVQEDLDQIRRPRAQSSASPPPTRESGMFRVTNHVEPVAPPAPAREASGQLWVRMPQSVLDVIEARAKAEGRSRSEEVRMILEEVLTRPEPARRVGT